MHSSIRSPVAVVFGSGCVLGTIIILFGHIRSIDDLTTSHLYIMLSLTVTLGAGHFMWDAFSDGLTGILRGLCLTVLFIVGTVVCVGMSGGRSAAIIAARDKEAADARTARAGLLQSISVQSAEVAQARKLSDAAEITATGDEATAKAECNKGKGPFCDGKTLSAKTSRTNATEVYTRWAKEIDKLATIQNDLRLTPEPPQPNPEFAQFAKVWAHLSNQSEESALAEIKLMFPYALALLTEFGAIVFLKEGFGPPAPKPEPKKDPPAVTVGDIARDLNIKPHVARRQCRELGIARPPEGWVWPHDEAQVIKQKLQMQRASVETVN